MFKVEKVNKGPEGFMFEVVFRSAAYRVKGSAEDLAATLNAFLDKTPPPAADSVVESLVVLHRRRAAHGLGKYGTNMDRRDLTPADWLNHLLEELMDAAVYARKCQELAKGAGT